MIPLVSTTQLQTRVNALVIAAIESMVDVRVWLTNQAVVIPTAPFEPHAIALQEPSAQLSQAGRLLRAAATLVRDHTPHDAVVDTHVVLDVIQQLRRAYVIHEALLVDMTVHLNRLKLLVDPFKTQ